jgi:hypothetical protein
VPQRGEKVALPMLESKRVLDRVQLRRDDYRYAAWIRVQGVNPRPAGLMGRHYLLRENFSVHRDFGSWDILKRAVFIQAPIEKISAS